MEDRHIHIRDILYDTDKLNDYIKECKQKKLELVVFLDHGNRISEKHKPVLYTKDTITKFIYLCELASQSGIVVLKGIEIDYSYNEKFRQETEKILSYAKFDWVVGAIHSIKLEKIEDYYNCVIDMINNYKIDCVAHLKLTDDYLNYEQMLKKICYLCSQKNISLEINTSDRSRWNNHQLKFMISLMKKYNVNYVLGSDAHTVSEIGYKISDIQEAIENTYEECN